MSILLAVIIATIAVVVVVGNNNPLLDYRVYHYLSHLPLPLPHKNTHTYGDESMKDDERRDKDLKTYKNNEEIIKKRLIK
jgi:hypothetical protein